MNNIRYPASIKMLWSIHDYCDDHKKNCNECVFYDFGNCELYALMQKIGELVDKMEMKGKE
jgi:hypothetical protein